MLLRFLIIFPSLLLLIFPSYSQQKIQINYNISCTLDLNKKTLKGEETIQLTNGSKESLNEIYLSLGMNAFRNFSSSFFKTLFLWKGIHREFKEFGSIDILSIRFNDNEIKDRFEFISPDGNTEDRTLGVLKIPSPILPGQSASFEIQFLTKSPEYLSGIGHVGDYFFFYHWYPKICSVEERDGKIVWSYYQFKFPPVANPILCNYRVEINVPRFVKVGGTGGKIFEKKTGKRKIARFYAENVSDFVWVASPAFLEYREALIPEKDFPIMDLKKLEKMERPEEIKEKIAIYLLIRPERKIYKERYLKSIKESLRFFWLNFSKYPFTSITFVDCPASGETEEILTPNLIICRHPFFTPPDSLYIEKIISRAIGLQYWGNIVLNNGIDELWLSNGISTYLENLFLRENFGEPVSYKYLTFIPVPSFETGGLPFLGFYLKKMKENPEVSLLLEYLRKDSSEPILKRSWDFQSPLSLNINTKIKPALIILTLERYFGKEKVLKALGESYRRYFFKKMKTEDFLEIIEEKMGVHARRLLENYLYRVDPLDFRVVEIKNEELRDGGKRYYLSSVTIEKRGELNFPVDIEISLENGKKFLERWDGDGNWKRFSYRGESRIKKVVIDPYNKFLLDNNRFNNSISLEERKKSFLKALILWNVLMGKFLHNLTFFI